MDGVITTGPLCNPYGRTVDWTRVGRSQIVIQFNSATDNPLFNQDNSIFHGGNFQPKSVTAAMDKTRQAAQTIARMIFTQCQKMVSPTT